MVHRRARGLTIARVCRLSHQVAPLQTMPRRKLSPRPIVHPNSSESARHAASWRTARTSFEHCRWGFPRKRRRPLEGLDVDTNSVPEEDPLRGRAYRSRGCCTACSEPLYRLKDVSAWQEPWQPALLQARSNASQGVWVEQRSEVSNAASSAPSMSARTAQSRTVWQMHADRHS